jgi:hypothetical protein
MFVDSANRDVATGMHPPLDELQFEFSVTQLLMDSFVPTEMSCSHPFVPIHSCLILREAQRDDETGGNHHARPNTKLTSGAIPFAPQ